MKSFENFTKNVEANNELANIIVAFHIGRGGRFYNAGHKTFIKWGANINDYVYDLFLDEEEKEYLDCNSHPVGLKKDNDGTGCIDEDGLYDTTYCVRMSEINEEEFGIICENHKNEYIPKEYETLFINE